jgi:GrpB-like predicted nucleotidyltransferase (UPF0157 family)
VCPRGSLALRNHLALRDHLRAHPPDVVSYSSLKAGKTDFVLSILAQYGF